MLKIKALFRYIVQLIIAIFTYFIVKEFVTTGGNATGSELLTELLIVLGGLTIIQTFFSDKFSFKDTVITIVICAVLIGGLQALSTNEKTTLASWLYALGLTFGIGLNSFLFNLGYLKGSLKRRNNQRLVAFGLVLANLFEVVSGIVMILTLLGVLKDSDFPITTIMIVGLIVACVVIVAGIVLAIVKGGGVYIKSSSKKQKAVTSTAKVQNQDTRKKDLSAFSSILYDELYSVANSYSGNKSLNKGSVDLSIKVNVSNGKIIYTIDGKVNYSDVKSEYDAKELSDSLNSKLENIRDSLFNETESKLNKLREKYQNYDGEYSVNVQVGNIK